MNASVRFVVTTMLMASVAATFASCAPSGQLVDVVLDQTASTGSASVRASYDAAMATVVTTLHGGDRVVGSTIGADSIAQASTIMDVTLPRYSVLGGNGHDTVASIRQVGPADDNARQVALASFQKAIQRSNEDASCIIDALGVAARLMGSGGARSRVLVVMSDGVEQCGNIDFSSSIPASAPSIAALRATHRLPDLSGVKVFWVGVLDSSYAPTDPAVGQRLRDWWSAFFQASGTALPAGRFGGSLIGWSNVTGSM